MFDQLLEGFRKASERSLEAQQDMFKQWFQQLPSAPSSAPLQHQWTEAETEMLNRHREFLDSMYKSGIQMIEQTARVSEARSPEEFRRLIEELWRTMSDTFREHSEAQFRELQRATDRWAELIQNVPDVMKHPPS